MGATKHAGVGARIGIRRQAARLPIAAGAAVMATAIVSIGLVMAGEAALSVALFVIAVAGWLGLGTVVVGRAIGDTRALRSEARSAPALTLVAGTAVIGQRRLEFGYAHAADAALALAACLWLVLLPGVVCNRVEPRSGSSFLIVVSTESLAALAAGCAGAQQTVWLAVAALALAVVGLVGYVGVLASFDLGEVRGGAGDQWIASGALAIATLACASIAQALATLPALETFRAPLADAAIGLWAAATLWLPLLLAGELASPRSRVDLRRWSTVFPLGMYAVCSMLVGRVASIQALVSLGRVWIWIAVTAWAAAALATSARVAPRPGRHAYGRGAGRGQAGRAGKADWDR